MSFAGDALRVVRESKGVGGGGKGRGKGVGVAVELTPKGAQSDLNAIRRDLRRVRKLHVRAAVRALNRVARDVERDAVATLASRANVPKGHIRWHHTLDGGRKNRRRLLTERARAKELDATWTWLPRSRDPVVKLGVLRPYQSRRGVRAGRHRVPGGFVPQRGAPRYGRKRGQVYRRTGEDRYPIDLQGVELRRPGDEAFRGRIARTGSQYRREFSEAMRAALERGRRA